jgi:hypothetical protein
VLAGITIAAAAAAEEHKDGEAQGQDRLWRLFLFAMHALWTVTASSPLIPHPHTTRKSPLSRIPPLSCPPASRLFSPAMASGSAATT